MSTCCNGFFRLTLAPVMCVLGGIALSSFLSNFYINIHEEPKKEKTTQQTQSSAPAKASKKDKSDNYPFKSEIGHIVIGVVALFCVSYVQHCVWVTSEAYRSVVIHSVCNLCSILAVLQLFWPHVELMETASSLTTSARPTTGCDRTLTKTPKS